MKLAPLIILGALTLIALGFTLAKDGESRGDYSFFSTLISAAIEWLLIWWAFK